MNLSLKQKIWAGFLILVAVFVLNSLVIIITQSNIQRVSNRISKDVNPAEQLFEDFKAIIIESKMYATNWVFLRHEQGDKDALVALHNEKYPRLKQEILALLPALNNKSITIAAQQAFKDFDELIVVEQGIMSQLEKFEDYDDPIKKMLAEQTIEDEVIPRTTRLLNTVNRVNDMTRNIEIAHESSQAKYTSNLRFLISFLSVFVIAIGITLAIYFTRVITSPITKIQQIITDLGKGIINKVNYKETQDEMGKMIGAVNNLSEKLSETAMFAEAVGNHNYELPFQPLSEEDKLGKALVTMRNNIRSGEENLMATNEELKKSNSELDKFVYSVSHDLRAPLSSMMGIVSLIEVETTDENIAGDIQLVKRNIEKLDGFIGDILDYSRNSRTDINAQEIDLNAMLKDVTSNLRYMATAGSKVTVRTAIRQNSAFFSDKTRVSVILNNLISNAIRYSSPAVENPYVSIDIEVDASEARIIIEDNGIGISPENLDKVFVMFYRVSKKSVGSGLGLYIVKETVEKLQGALHLESELDKGTKFVITLPNLTDNNL